MNDLDSGAELIRDRFQAYLAMAAAKGYCGPFVPYVGPRYDASPLRVIYAGVAPYLTDDVPFNDIAVAAEWSRSVAEDADISSPFWRLLDDVLALWYESESPGQRRQRVVWSNLSKLNWRDKATAPRDSDRALRSLNVEQFRHELSILAPDLLVCVSGNNLVETGRELFAYMLDEGVKLRAEQTWMRRLPTGGALYWTMHPGYKSADWKAGVLADIAMIVGGARA